MKSLTEQKIISDPKEISVKRTVEISIKENPKLERLRAAPEEVVAKAIREMIRKDRGEG